MNEKICDFDTVNLTKEELEDLEELKCVYEIFTKYDHLPLNETIDQLESGRYRRKKSREEVLRMLGVSEKTIQETE